MERQTKEVWCSGICFHICPGNAFESASVGRLENGCESAQLVSGTFPFGVEFMFSRTLGWEESMPTLPCLSLSLSLRVWQTPAQQAGSCHQCHHSWFSLGPSDFEYWKTNHLGGRMVPVNALKDIIIISGPNSQQLSVFLWLYNVILRMDKQQY